MRQHAAALLAVELHLAELFAFDIGQTIVPGQALIDKRKISVEEVQNAAILFHNRGEEQLGLLLHRRAERFVKSRVLVFVGLRDFQISQLQPLPGKVVDQGLRPGILQHTLDLPSEVIALAQRAEPRHPDDEHTRQGR